MDATRCDDVVKLVCIASSDASGCDIAGNIGPVGFCGDASLPNACRGPRGSEDDRGYLSDQCNATFPDGKAHCAATLDAIHVSFGVPCAP